MDYLESQFTMYQIDGNISYDPEVRIDLQWSNIGLIEDLSRNTEKYPLLVTVMKGILIIFHRKFVF